MNRKGPHLIILVCFKTNHIPQHFTTKLLLQYDYYNQARIYTGFHRFTEICQIFHNKKIF